MKKDMIQHSWVMDTWMVILFSTIFYMPEKGRKEGRKEGRK